MMVSRGMAVVWSTALHTAGLGVAGWATYGRYDEPAPVLALHTTRVHALHYLTLVAP